MCQSRWMAPFACGRLIKGSSPRPRSGDVLRDPELHPNEDEIPSVCASAVCEGLCQMQPVRLLPEDSWWFLNTESFLPQWVGPD